MAALDQRCRDNDGEKAGLAQQGARAVQRRRSGLWAVQGLKAEADDGAEPRYGSNDPDQVLCRDDIDQQPAGQRSCDERRRAPQPQRPVVQAVARHASQRIGVRQRHRRRPHTRVTTKAANTRSG
jgi:hypothetical protein